MRQLSAVPRVEADANPDGQSGRQREDADDRVREVGEGEEVNGSPASDSVNESLSCLRYANSAKNIENKPQVNRDKNASLIVQLREEIKQLRQELMQQRGGQSPQQIDQLARRLLESKGASQAAAQEEAEREQQAEELEAAKKRVAELQAENASLAEALEKERRERSLEKAEYDYRVRNGVRDGDVLRVGGEELSVEALQQIDISSVSREESLHCSCWRSTSGRSRSWSGRWRRRTRRSRTWYV